MSKAIMIQGTGSNVGKSMLVAGLARAFGRRGLRVRPFKPQNMSNNAAVCPGGGEIGRAQALQARAAGVDPHVDMNPVLLKPQSESGAQVVLQGQVLGFEEARAFFGKRGALLTPVLESFNRLRADADLVLVEGAGSPAETNLRKGDIANMGFARAADVPVVLAGDIDRGGVIAQIVGTQAVLDAGDAAMIRAFVINKFRGDVSLFDAGLRDIVARTGLPALGVVPWFDSAHRLPAEDALDLPARAGGSGGAIKVVVPVLPRIANFDDLDPLAAEPGVTLELVQRGRALPGDADLVLLCGSKATLADLADLRAAGWDIDIAAHVRRGGHVMGLCGGYQMLGRSIADPDGIEGRAGTAEGLGLLDVETVLEPVKTLELSHGRDAHSGAPLQGYEIHMGRTTGPDTARAWVQLQTRMDGAASAQGRVRGTYLHGLFASDTFRAAFLGQFGGTAEVDFEAGIEGALDALADHLEAHMDLDRLLSLAR
ncbi:MAG: cobyric acid synthase [Pseudomonadota bacterium]